MPDKDKHISTLPDTHDDHEVRRLLIILRRYHVSEQRFEYLAENKDKLLKRANEVLRMAGAPPIKRCAMDGNLIFEGHGLEVEYSDKETGDTVRVSAVCDMCAVIVTRMTVACARKHESFATLLHGNRSKILRPGMLPGDKPN